MIGVAASRGISAENVAAFGNNVAAGVRRLQDGAAPAGTQIGEAIEYTTSRHLDLAGQMKIPGTRQQAAQHLAIELDRNLQQPPRGKLCEKIDKGSSAHRLRHDQLILGRSGGDGPHQAVCLGDIWRCARRRPFAVAFASAARKPGSFAPATRRHFSESGMKSDVILPVVPSIRKPGACNFVTQMAADRFSPTSWIDRSLADFYRGYGSGVSLSLT